MKKRLAVHLTAIVAVFGGLLYGMQNCGHPDDIELLSLDNYAAGDLRQNVCQAHPENFSAKSALIDRIIFDDTVPGDQRPRLAAEAALALSGVPLKIQKLFALFSGRLTLTNDVAKACEQPQKNTDLLACFRIGEDRLSSRPQTLEIVVKAEPAAIRHSVVRQFGFVYSEFMAKLQPVAGEDTSLVFQMSPTETDQMLVAKKLLADAFIKDMHRNRALSVERFIQQYKLSKDQTVLAEKIRNDVFAEAFDSFYCNDWENAQVDLIRGVRDGDVAISQLASEKNTRVVMQYMFPESYQVFSKIHCDFMVAEGVRQDCLRNLQRAGDSFALIAGEDDFFAESSSSEPSSGKVIRFSRPLVVSDQSPSNPESRFANGNDTNESNNLPAAGNPANFGIFRNTDYPADAAAPAQASSPEEAFQNIQYQNFLSQREKYDKAYNESSSAGARILTDYQRLNNQLNDAESGLKSAFEKLPPDRQQQIRDEAQAQYIAMVQFAKEQAERDQRKEASRQFVFEQTQKKELIQKWLPKSDFNSMTLKERDQAYKLAGLKYRAAHEKHDAFYDTLSEELRKNGAKTADWIDNQSVEAFATAKKNGLLSDGEIFAANMGLYYVKGGVKATGNIGAGISDFAKNPKTQTTVPVQPIIDGIIAEKNGRRDLYVKGGASPTYATVIAWAPGVSSIEKGITDVDNDGYDRGRTFEERGVDIALGTSEYAGSWSGALQTAKSVSGRALVRGVGGLSQKSRTLSKQAGVLGDAAEDVNSGRAIAKRINDTRGLNRSSAVGAGQARADLVPVDAITSMPSPKGGWNNFGDFVRDTKHIFGAGEDVAQARQDAWKFYKAALNESKIPTLGVSGDQAALLKKFPGKYAMQGKTPGLDTGFSSVANDFYVKGLLDSKKSIKLVTEIGDSKKLVTSSGRAAKALKALEAESPADFKKLLARRGHKSIEQAASRPAVTAFEFAQLKKAEKLGLGRIDRATNTFIPN